MEDLARTFSWLEEAFRERDSQLAYLAVNRRFAGVRDDTRFQQLLDRIGLTPAAGAIKRRVTLLKL